MRPGTAQRKRYHEETHAEDTMCYASLLCAALAGCTVGPKYHPPATQTAPAFKEAPPAADTATPQNPNAPANDTQADAANWTVAQPADAKIRGDWWTIFNDPELSDLESQLNINNQTIKVSFENYMQARSLVRVARAQYFPTINAGPAYTRQKTSGNLSNTTTANTGRTSQIYSLPLDVSWTPDLFGRIRNQVHEAQYSAQVSAADLENERLIEQADLATYFFEVRGQDALIKLYRQTVASVPAVGGTDTGTVSNRHWRSDWRCSKHRPRSRARRPRSPISAFCARNMSMRLPR